MGFSLRELAHTLNVSYVTKELGKPRIEPQQDGKNVVLRLLRKKWH
jgi:hypothetical protein